ncbi:MAG: TIGR00730 family Rossman fold protein [Clostridia bacterium]|nr:TIGR00730 family Rossman fold protein [Clostridia bacterium]
MNICVYGAASSEIDKSFIDAGEELGRKLVERGHGLVFGGGANGMMGAVARGVHQKNGYILGIAPGFFNVDGVSYDECTEFIHTDTMRERKRLLDEKSNGFVISPGGIGTFDEFFEILTLKQLGRHNKPIVIWNLNNYFENMENMMQVSVDKKFVTDDCRELYKVCNTTDEILDYIENYDEKDIDLSKVKIR